MAYLEIETRDGTRRVSLERERLSIGRLSHNDVVLPFAQISRKHAELRRINGQWWIADLQSTNGLQINSHRIYEHALADGDRIVMAPGISLVFVADGAAESPSHRPSMPPSLAPSTLPAPPAPTSSPWPSQSPFSLAGAAGRDGWRQLSPDVQGHGSLYPWAQSPAAAGLPRYGADSFEPGRPVLGGNGRTGYAVPDDLELGERDGYDPYRRESSAYERTYATAGPAGTLLHVCQTCGQLTAPDAVYCQSCHNSIAHECTKCYLSLLPIQDRCPRCHTPNRMSVRRAHPGRSL